MADRPVTRARHDSDGDVIAIGNPNESWSPILKDDAIYDIDNGINTYYVPWANDPHTPIRVVQGAYGRYLRTDRDTTERNNLDDLLEC